MKRMQRAQRFAESIMVGQRIAKARCGIAAVPLDANPATAHMFIVNHCAAVES